MKRIFKQTIFSLIFLSGFLTCQNAQAATTYYVQSTCEAGITTYNPATYSCTGGSATVFPTIMGAINTLNLEGDDILEVRADSEGGSKTYFETVTIGAADGGDVDNPVIVRARTGDTITIDGSDTRRQGIVISGSNITVDGFHVDNVMPTTLASYAISAVTNGQSNVTIKNCTVNISLAGGVTSQPRVGIATGGSSWDGRIYNITVQENTITTDTDDVADQTDMFRGGNIEGLILDGNSAVNNNANSGTNHDDVYQMWNVKDGVYSNNYGNSPHNRVYQQTFYLELYNNGTVENPTDYGNHLIYNNVFVGYGGSYVFHILSRTDTGVPSIVTAQVYNNVFDAFAGINSLPVRMANCQTIDFKNNISIAQRDGTPRYVLAVENSTLTADNNIYYIVPYSADAIMSSINEVERNFTVHKEAGYDVNSYYVNPSLDANYKSDAADDPAVGTGVDLSSTFTTDILGITRSGDWDIGAYEYTGADDIVAPASPTGLAVT